MLVKHLSRCFGKFSGYKFPNSSCVQGGLHGEYFEKFILHYFHSTAEFDITFLSASSSRPSGTNHIRTRYNVGACPYISNKTQRNTTQVSVGRFDDLIWNMTSKKWGKFVELADRATDIMGYRTFMFQPSLLRILQVIKNRWSLPFSIFQTKLYLQQNKSLLYYRCLKLSYRRWCFSSKVWTRRKFIYRFEIGEWIRSKPRLTDELAFDTQGVFRLLPIKLE